jgi:hypothetical protein
MLRWPNALAIAIASGCQTAFPAPDAASADGRWRVEGAAGSVVVLDAGRPIKTLPARRLAGGPDANVVDVRPLTARRSFAIAFDTLPELWELSVDPDAPPVYEGLVHDYRMGEGLGTPGYLGVRRTPLDTPLRAIAADASNAYLLARAPDTPEGLAQLLLLQLDVRRPIARWRLDADPDLAAARAEPPGFVVPDRDRSRPPIVVDVRAVMLTRPAPSRP